MITSISSEVEEVSVEGQRAWLLASQVVQEKPGSPEGGFLRLVPQYDCYLLGCGQRERIVSEAARKRIHSHGRGKLEGAVGLPLLLVDGVVAGMWERRKHGKLIELRVEPFLRLSSRQQKQLEEEAARVGGFLGGEVSLTLGELN